MWSGGEQSEEWKKRTGVRGCNLFLGGPKSENLSFFCLLPHNRHCGLLASTHFPDCEPLAVSEREREREREQGMRFGFSGATVRSLLHPSCALYCLSRSHSLIWCCSLCLRSVFPVDDSSCPCKGWFSRDGVVVAKKMLAQGGKRERLNGQVRFNDRFEVVLGHTELPSNFLSR